MQAKNEWSSNACREIRVILIFPKERRCRRATITTETKKSNRVITRGRKLDTKDQMYFSNLEDGRQQLLPNFDHPKTNVKIHNQLGLVTVSEML